MMTSQNAFDTADSRTDSLTSEGDRAKLTKCSACSFFTIVSRGGDGALILTNRVKVASGFTLGRFTIISLGGNQIQAVSSFELCNWSVAVIVSSN